MSDTILKTNWKSLCETLGIPEFEQKWSIITAHYQAEGRSYHNLRHITFCLNQMVKFLHMVEQPALVAYAFWMHDIVYSTRENDNEKRSADLARLWLDHDPEAMGVVTDLIMATVHPSSPVTNDQMFVVDTDLAILGASKDVYELCSQAVRAEYAWVPEQAYKVGRGKVLEGFLKQDQIYHHPSFIASWEQQARINLAWEISRL
jgi:predicted metal-dependent HD superfamily phosphohydrolase